MPAGLRRELDLERLAASEALGEQSRALVGLVRSGQQLPADQLNEVHGGGEGSRGSRSRPAVKILIIVLLIAVVLVLVLAAVIMVRFGRRSYQRYSGSSISVGPPSRPVTPAPTG